MPNFIQIRQQMIFTPKKRVAFTLPRLMKFATLNTFHGHLFIPNLISIGHKNAENTIKISFTSTK
jgi:hypothetical protein